MPSAVWPALGPATFSLAPAPDWEDDECPHHSSSEGDSDDEIPTATIVKKRRKKRKGGVILLTYLLPPSLTQLPSLIPHVQQWWYVYLNNGGELLTKITRYA